MAILLLLNVRVKDMNQKERESAIYKVVAQAWKDPVLCQKLIDNPAKVLRSAGVIVGSLAVVSVVTYGEDAMAQNLRIEVGQEVYEAPLGSSNHLSDERLPTELNVQEPTVLCIRICT